MATEYISISGDLKYVNYNRIESSFRKKTSSKKLKDRTPEINDLKKEGNNYLRFLIERLEEGKTMEEAIEQTESAYKDVQILKREVGLDKHKFHNWELWFIF